MWLMRTHDSVTETKHAFTAHLLLFMEVIYALQGYFKKSEG